ncbi:tripartite tricarboxylate transporter substrate binding protein [Cupriavidus sp. CV2]|uniref:Bug family tripartite tricarboxylate transporter substrate binding protein n=1 Tax=Cupriavidus ulmosensis TaxID=3065913 RepID=UPI00296AF492|nr:tripartite tricarboxylate transporter substrate binding protein [Cupriavidus sp. CV2]MDW3682795.1 tripartite tricarboxylate transporter substrate binding protein [Cupriavidus sp. CV2]
MAKNTWRQLFLAGICCYAFGAVADSGGAPTRIVVASAPGGNLDVLARILAEKLGATQKRTYIVENRPGAGGNIATAQVAHAKPDGRTLLVVSTSHTSNVHVYKKVGYDPIKDFTPIAKLAESAFVVAVPVDSSITSLADLEKAAKARPGSLNHGSSGIGQGNHLGMELLKNRLGLKITHVPFTSANALVTALMGKQVDVAMLTLPGALMGVRAGKIRLLAVTSQKRVEQLASVPTVEEKIGGDFVMTSWQGLVAPAGLPAKEAADLSKQVASVMAQPEVVGALDSIALTPQVTSPDAFQQFLVKETRRWGDVANQSNIRMD